MRITNLLFWVQENTASTRFYKRLGFNVEHTDDEYSVVSLGGFSITLVNMRDEEKFVADSLSSDKGRGVYVYINTEDVNKKYDDLVSLGFRPSTEPKDWRWGNREFILKDPDGYKLCFWQAIGDTTHAQRYI